MGKLISEHITPKAWLLLSVGDEQQYGGNIGYEDEISKMYQYDSTVKKSKEVTEGDLVLLRDKKQLLGIFIGY